MNTLAEQKHNVNFIVSKKCGITAQMLFGQPPFLVVFQELTLWVKQCVEEVRKRDAAYHPGKVLQIQYHSQSVTFTFIY